jgi:hypothetical protein
MTLNKQFKGIQSVLCFFFSKSPILILLISWSISIKCHIQLVLHIEYELLNLIDRVFILQKSNEYILL